MSGLPPRPDLDSSDPIVIASPQTWHARPDDLFHLVDLVVAHDAQFPIDRGHHCEGGVYRLPGGGECYEHLRVVIVAWPDDAPASRREVIERQVWYPTADGGALCEYTREFAGRRLLSSSLRVSAGDFHALTAAMFAVADPWLGLPAPVPTEAFLADDRARGTLRTERERQALEQRRLVLRTAPIRPRPGRD